MDINKNSYTFGFAAIMVIVVAALLSFAATKLKPFQDVNIELEKKQNILSSVGINVSREDAEFKYSEYITDEIVLNNKTALLKDNDTINIVKNNFSFAFSNFFGLVHKDSNLHELPRFLVRDWPIQEFKNKIENFFNY